MKATTTSYWIDSEPGRPYATLDEDVDVDVAIVGGGITGITAALLLRRAGLSVALLEARRIGEGDTGRTTAHVTELLDTRYHQLISDFGEEGARLAASSQRAAIDRIAQFAREDAIGCGFQRVPGYLYAEPGSNNASEIEKEAEAAKRVGLTVSLTNEVPLPFPTERAFRLENQAQMHALRYLRPLADRLELEGGRVFEQARVVDVEDGAPCRVRTENGRTVRARDVLVTTYSPVSNRFTLHTVVYAYRSYVVAIKMPRAPEGLFWDTAEPYHYTRSQALEGGGQLLIVGGEDHKTGTNHDTRAAFDSLEAYARHHFGEHPIAYNWSGQILDTADGLPYVGRNPHDDHVYVATGYAGNGITHGTMAGMLLSDLVLERRNPWAELYSPSRIKPIASAKGFVQENASVAAHLIGDWLKPGEAPDVEHVRPGEGKLVSHHGHKLAVFRDQSGAVSMCSAVCPHLGCIVQWNNAEQSWDCPCHGSRFEPTGAVINGPSTRPLTPKPL